MCSLSIVNATLDVLCDTIESSFRTCRRVFFNQMQIGCLLWSPFLGKVQQKRG